MTFANKEWTHAASLSVARNVVHCAILAHILIEISHEKQKFP